MKSIDIQWPDPSAYMQLKSKRSKLSLFDRRIELESYFSKLYGVQAHLLPSARSAVSAVMQCHGFNRGHVCWMPKWNSHCMYIAMGAFSNVSINARDTADLYLVNHKWGYQYKLQKPDPISVIVEDSVDTIFTDSKRLFANGGKYEVISLPKVMGSFSGGLLLTTDLVLEKFLQRKRLGGEALAKIQSLRKRALIMGRKAENWYYDETQNFSLDKVGLDNISATIPVLDLNFALIQERQYLVGQKLGKDLLPEKGRLGPVIPLPSNRFKSNLLLERQFSKNRSIKKLDFSSHLVLPIHVGISQSDFLNMLNKVKKV